MGLELELTPASYYSIIFLTFFAAPTWNENPPNVGEPQKFRGQKNREVKNNVFSGASKKIK